MRGLLVIGPLKTDRFARSPFENDRNSVCHPLELSEFPSFISMSLIGTIEQGIAKRTSTR